MTPEQIKSVEFHIEQDDYHPTLATVIRNYSELKIAIPYGTEEKLLWVHKHYKLVKR